MGETDAGAVDNAVVIKGSIVTGTVVVGVVATGALAGAVATATGFGDFDGESPKILTLLPPKLKKDFILSGEY